MRFCLNEYVFLVVVVHKSTSQVVNIDTVFWLEDRGLLGKVSSTHALLYIARQLVTCN